MNPMQEILDMGFEEVRTEPGHNEFRSWISHYYEKWEYTLYFEEIISSVNGFVTDDDKRDGMTILKLGHHTIDQGSYRLFDL